jgi:hypothetical protein
MVHLEGRWPMPGLNRQFSEPFVALADDLRYRDESKLRQEHARVRAEGEAAQARAEEARKAAEAAERAEMRQLRLERINQAPRWDRRNKLARMDAEPTVESGGIFSDDEYREARWRRLMAPPDPKEAAARRAREEKTKAAQEKARQDAILAAQLQESSHKSAGRSRRQRKSFERGDD